MRNIWLVLAACIPLATAAESVSLSGKVTDKSGKPLAGIWVGLEKTMIATLTANDGSWSLNGNTGVAAPSTRSIPVTRHLVREGGRLRVSLDGTDAIGRNLSVQESFLPASSSNTASRKTAAIVDTVLYVIGNRLLASTPVSSGSIQLGTEAIDTSSVVNFTRSGDTIRTAETSYFDASCSSQGLSVWVSKPDAILLSISMTPDGFELSNAGIEAATVPYMGYSKYRRLSGTSGTLIGRFQVVGAVLRPRIDNVPDSTRRIIAEDSARMDKTIAAMTPIYDVSETSFALVNLTRPSFARQTLIDWSYADQGKSYSPSDSTWRDERRYSDSAQYDIAVQIVDSSTVRLTGAKTGEIVTIRGTPVTNGFDRTYSSSNSAHATGTRLAILTSCPEPATWYGDFKSANGRSTPFAARRIEPSSAPNPPHPPLLLTP